ncbi:MAG: hypothetical protein ABJG78_02995 [Cyclobacteriaceae bacterium]
MKENNEEEYKNSSIWGVIFIVIFTLTIFLMIWAVTTGNYNTP